MFKKSLALALALTFVLPASASALDGHPSTRGGGPGSKGTMSALIGPSTAVVPAVLRKKYAYFNTNDRVVFEGRMQLIRDSQGIQEQKGFSIVGYTERYNGTKWVRYTMCGGQDWTFRYSVRPAPYYDYFHDDQNAAFGSFSIEDQTSQWWAWRGYTLSLHVTYSVNDPRCNAPWNASKSASFASLEFSA